MDSQQGIHKSLPVQWEPTWDISDTTDEASRNYKPSFTHVHIHTCFACSRYRMQVHSGWDACIAAAIAKRQSAPVSDNQSGSVLLLLLLLSSRQAFLSSMFTFHFRRTDRRRSLVISFENTAWRCLPHAEDSNAYGILTTTVLSIPNYFFLIYWNSILNFFFY